MEVTEADRKLLAAFKSLHVTPKADTPEELQTWIKEYGHTLEGKPVAAATAAATPITVSTNQPRLPIFYGDTETVTKGECTYDQWIYEVKSLLTEKTHKIEVVKQAIRRSLRGDAFKILMRLPPGSDIREIVDKFESVYGQVESRATLLSKFYGARQREEEDTTAWTCRLEELLNKLVEKRLIETKDTNQMLCDMFWTGLRQDLKDVTGYKFEQIKEFDKLRVEVRKIEQEHKATSIGKKEGATTGTSKCAVEAKDETKKEIQELREMMKTMASTVTGIGERMEELSGSIHRQQIPAEDRNRDRYTDRTPQGNRPEYAYGNRSRYQRPPYRQYTNRRGRFNRNRRPYRNYGNTREYEGQNDTNQGPECYSCGQIGHYQWQCTSGTDYRQQKLN